MKSESLRSFLLFILLGAGTFVTAQNKAIVNLDLQKREADISPTLHGIFFEEINHAGEGGLYAELIQNRGFEESRLPQGTALEDGFIIPVREPHFMLPDNGISDWKMAWPHSEGAYPGWEFNRKEGLANAFLTTENPLTDATPHSMQINLNGVQNHGDVELLNHGFWGIHTVAGDEYRLGFYARTSPGFGGNIKISLRNNRQAELAVHEFKDISGGEWKKYEVILTASDSCSDAAFVMSFMGKGTVWVDFVSLFPVKTFKGRANGMRKDLAEFIQGMKPSFVRWPGGCFAEGINIESAPDWKRTIGPVEGRPGTYSPWGYWSSDGFGFHEFLQFCEDLHADALYVFNAGISCEYRSGTFVPDSSLGDYIQSALDAIEYAIGPVTSKWGAARAANGHPSPFPLKYVEVGNEQHGPRYAERYNLFYDAIKARYPDMIIMASMGIGDVNANTTDSMRKIDYVDEHAYKPAYWAMNNTDHFQKYKRGDWKMYVGEYATNSGVGAGNMLAALSDAVYIMSMEKNGDLVRMSSYAPLFVNVNDVSWPVNLIHYNASESFARISYYVIKMFNGNRPDYNIATSVQIHKEKSKEPMFTGSVGLASWDTQVEYKDLKITKGSKVLYERKEPSARDWEFSRGDWGIHNKVLKQSGEGAQRLAWLKGKIFDTYTLTVKARKTGGLNAFIIPFAVKDSNTQLRAHIGSWWNRYAMFEKVTDGFDVVSVSNPTKIKPIEDNRWYEIRLEVGMEEVKCYVDDELIITYTQPPDFFTIAGVDEQTDEVVVKVVNSSEKPVETQLRMDGLKKGTSSGKWISLKAENAEAENSFSEPEKYIPVEEKITVKDGEVRLNMSPLSVNVIRMPKN